jgi:hypothetical protein
MSKKNIPPTVGFVKLFLIVLFSISVCFSYNGLSIIKKGNTWEYYSKSKGGDASPSMPGINTSSIEVFIVDTVYSLFDSLLFTITESDSGYDSTIMAPIMQKGSYRYLFHNDSIFSWGATHKLAGVVDTAGWRISTILFLTGYNFTDSVSLVLYNSDTLHLNKYSTPPGFCDKRAFRTLENYGLLDLGTSVICGMTYSYSSDQLISFNHVLFDSTKLHPLATPIEHVPLISKRSCSLRAWTNNTGVATIYLPDHATPVSLSVFDIRGRQIQQFDRIAENAFQWDCGRLHGLYVVKAMIDGKAQTAKIVPAK